MTALLVLAPLDAEDEIEPHPEPVRIQHVGTGQFMTAATVLGVWPDGSYLTGGLCLTAR